MKMQQIKREAGDYKRTERWARLVPGYDAPGAKSQIIGIGKEYVRVVIAKGQTAILIDPRRILEVW